MSTVSEFSSSAVFSFSSALVIRFLSEAMFFSIFSFGSIDSLLSRLAFARSIAA